MIRLIMFEVAGWIVGTLAGLLLIIVVFSSLPLPLWVCFLLGFVFGMTGIVAGMIVAFKLEQ